MAEIDAQRALAQAGVPFRAQGRDPERGLDCVGLVLCACGMGSDGVPDDYRLRGNHLTAMRKLLRVRFRRVSPRQRRIGDVLLLAPGPDQFHLVVLTARGFVHADARLRRVVETPGLPSWPIIAIYRRRVRPKRGK